MIGFGSIFNRHALQRRCLAAHRDRALRLHLTGKRRYVSNGRLGRSRRPAKIDVHHGGSLGLLALGAIPWYR
jgi:hypothetical protein